MVNELNVRGSNLTNSKDIAEGFNDFCSNIGPHLACKIDTSNCNFQEYIKNIESEFTAFEAVTIDKLYHFLCGLSGTKATGIDRISIKIFKIAAPVISSSLTYIFIRPLLMFFSQRMENGQSHTSL